MDKRSEERMLMIFKMNFKDQCEHTDLNNADTVILDMDGKNIVSEWSAFRLKNPDVPAIIMATDYVELIGTLYISKPAKLSELLAALKDSSKKDISSNLNASHNTHNVAKALQNRYQKHSYNTSESSDSFELFYNPEKFLQGQLVKAISESNKIKKSIFIKCWSEQWIIVFPSTNYLLQNVSNAQIKTLGLVQMGDDMAYSEHTFSKNEISHMARSPTSSVKVISVEQFMWSITVKTARGRVPEGTSLDELYVVQRWPNLPRLSYIPNATRISAFWIDQAQSIKNIVSKLNIPQEDVLTYFSAASAIGLLKPATRREDHLSTPDIITLDKKKHGIFAALFSRINKNIKPDKVANDEQRKTG